MPRPISPVAVLLVIGISLVPVTPRAQAQQGPASIGRIKHAAGAAFVVRSGQPQPASVGTAVVESDLLRTGPDGRLALMLKDESRVSIGPNTEIGLTRFAYAPAQGQLAMVLRLVQGAMSYISGRIAELQPDAVRVETPSSVIGVRGTHVLVQAGRP